NVVAVDVDAEQGEGLVLQGLDERPLVGPLGSSGESLLMPEVEQHHLAAIVAELEALAVLVLAFDVRRFLADTQVVDLEQLRPGLLTDRAVVGVFHVAILLRGLLKKSFGLPGGPGAVLPQQIPEVILAE